MRAKFLLSAQNVSIDAEIDPEHLISAIKVEISSELKVDWDEQKWVYKGKVLSNEVTLTSVGFVDGDAIHVLKCIRTVSDSQQATSSTTQFMPVPHFDNAMRLLLSRNSDEDSVKQCLLTISKVLKNIINKPLEEKYRKLKASNPLVQQKILNCLGAQDVLLALGFTLFGEEWVVQANYLAWNNITACNAKLDKFLAKLLSASAPDPDAPPSQSATPPSPTIPVNPPAASGKLIKSVRIMDKICVAIQSVHPHLHQ